MVVRPFAFNPFQTNCYVCHSEGEGILVDAASYEPDEHAEIEQYLADEGIRIRHLLLTHGHIDHIFGCRHFSDRFGLPFKMHAADRALLQQAEQQATMFGIPLEIPPDPTEFLEEGDRIEFGACSLEVLLTPGHSPGSISFFDSRTRRVFSGDVLFAGSIGRTDLWRGSLPTLLESIFQKLVPLGDDVIVLSGHGPATSIGEQLQSNPFLKLE